MAQDRSIYKFSAIVAVVLAVAVAAVWFALGWLARHGNEAVVPDVVQTAGVEPSPSPGPTREELWSERLQGVTLRTSDAVVRELVAEVSSHPKLAEWLVNEDLIRRFTAAVDNVARGKSPRAHLGFLTPGRPFAVLPSGEGFTIDPRTYHRYDLAANVFHSLDTAGTVTMYRELRPLIAEAYREIAPPGHDFEDTLLAAIDSLQAVPIPESEIAVQVKVLTYTFEDESLEGLSDAQRHLLRMGPDNVRLVQAKLGEIEAQIKGP